MRGVINQLKDKAGDAFQNAKRYLDKDSPLLSDPNFMSKVLGVPDAVVYVKPKQPFVR